MDENENIDEMQDAIRERWFVLNMIVGGGANITENPTHECFETERDAIAHAKECAASQDASVPDVYHIMRTVSVVTSTKRIVLKTIKPSRAR